MVRLTIGYGVIGLAPLGFYFLQASGIDLIDIAPVHKILTLPNYLGFALVGILGWRLNQSRILITVALMIGAYYITLNTEVLASTGIGKVRLRQILSFAVPVALMLIFLTKEARLISRQSFLRAAAALSPAAAMGLWFVVSPAGFHKAASFEIVRFGPGFKIPQLSFLAVALLMIGFVRVRDKKIRGFMGAAVMSLIPFFSMAHIGLASGTTYNLKAYSVLCYSAVCIILLHSILRMYWQRVYVDELTDIGNRRALDERLDVVRGDYAIGMIDIDHFKKFNDTHGHDEGDNALRFVASILEKAQGGRAYRYGGEEFCVIFEGVAAPAALAAADRIRRKLAGRKFFIRTTKDGKKPSKTRKAVRVTISAGIAGSDGAVTGPSEVLKRADSALYRAKEQGRNRVVLFK